MKSYYPSDVVSITQSYDEGNHVEHWNGVSIKDYPIDENYGSSKKSGYFRAPFDCEVVKKYVRDGSSNGLWLTSIEEVETPVGKDYVTIMIGHVGKTELEKIEVGRVYSQFENIVMEDSVGKASGYHHHISCGIGYISGSGWCENESGCWVLTTTKGARKPEEIFYINEDNTVIKSDRGISFQKDNEKENNVLYKRGDKHEAIGKISTFMRKVFPAYTDVKALGDYYGPYIESSIKEFQKRSGIKVSGCIDQDTLDELGKYGFKLS